MRKKPKRDLICEKNRVRHYFLMALLGFSIYFLFLPFLSVLALSAALTDYLLPFLALFHPCTPISSPLVKIDAFVL
jgi:hypothetical protein